MDNANQTATKEHCAYCFDVLIAALQKKAIPAFPQNLPQFKCPLFVTWHINGDDLRGCIGTFQEADINKQLPKYAQIAAFEDSRFDPIQKSELPYLNVAVSFLVNFEQASGPLDWEVGKHGIIIDFMEQYNATFLPEVASEQGWDQKTTLQHLIKKAGYKGKLESILDKIKLTRYQSSQAKLDFKDYSKLREGNK